jgi:hypothetical protein
MRTIPALSEFPIISVVHPAYHWLPNGGHGSFCPGVSWLLILCSCKNPDTTQSPAYPRTKATMATIRKPVVCSELCPGFCNCIELAIIVVGHPTDHTFGRVCDRCGIYDWPPFGSQWYAGCTTLIIGNSLKAGIRASTCHNCTGRFQRG